MRKVREREDPYSEKTSGMPGIRRSTSDYSLETLIQHFIPSVTHACEYE